MTDKLEAFLADYEDRLGRWHGQGDGYELGLKLTALVRAFWAERPDLKLWPSDEIERLIAALPEPTDAG